jgi:molybdenum cofactor cytidylyltransferase
VTEMKFGRFAVSFAEGFVLAHSAGGLKKGRVLSKADIDVLRSAGLAEIHAAQFDPDDVHENEAARIIARQVGGPGIEAREAFTGRVNLYSGTAGVLGVDREGVDRFNAIHESMTLATLPSHAAVAPKQMVATVKIIPFSVTRAQLDAALHAIGDWPLISLHAFTQRRAGLVITETAGGKATLAAKSEAAMRERIESLGSKLEEVVRCPHDAVSVSAAIGKLRGQGCSPILLFGASAIVDRGDVIPAALVQSGGEVLHLGMPVDPGNLMMLGKLGEADVIGVPSCARSPKENGFDWVLQRLLAGMKVEPSDVMAMGVGGLLAEISTRPSPREGKPVARAPRIAAIVLAAGQSTRMGSNKLLAEIDGAALVTRAVETLKHARLDDIFVVTGHESKRVEAAVSGVRTVFNPHYAMGMATSLRAGLAAVEADAALVCLGDMPLVDAATIGKLISAFDPIEHRSICIPVFKGRRGNPVLWGRQHFPALMAIEGDQGGRALHETLADEIIDIPVSNDGVLKDADTPEALQGIRKELRSASTP